MALDYIIIVISFFILILYVLTLLLLMHTRKRLEGKARTAFTFFIMTLFFLIIRRLQQVFTTSQFFNPLPYSIDVITLLLAITLFLGVFYFHQAINKARTEKKFNDFKQQSTTKSEGKKEKELKTFSSYIKN